MTRSDLLTDLVKYGMNSDRVKFRKVVEAIIAEERGKKHTILADSLEELLITLVSEKNLYSTNSLIDQRLSTLFHEIKPERSFADLILPDDVREISTEIIREHYREELLHSYNLEPRNRILLIGPPGNGKTSLAEAFALSLFIPFIVVRYEGVIGTYLGETANRLRRLIEYASTRKCVLFFDEFETLGKERGDRHETGEIKRVVSSLLLQIDSLPSHVVVICATNHPELLDRAVWRRFQVRMNLPVPDHKLLTLWFYQFEERIQIHLGYPPEYLANQLHGVSFAEAEEFGVSAFRKYVLNQPGSNMKEIIDQTLTTWKALSVKVKQQNGGDE